MPNFKSISFKMAVLQRGGQCVCVIQKTPCGTGLTLSIENVDKEFWK